MEEQTQPCSNCKMQIPESKHMLHELYCQRNCQKCSKCARFYDINDEESHMEEFHKKTKCIYCSKEFEGETDHQQKCSMKPIKCAFCNVEQTPKQLKEHESKCGSRTQLCQYCNKLILIKNLDQHETQCQFEQFSQQVKNKINEKQASSKQNNPAIQQQSEQKQIPQTQKPIQTGTKIMGKPVEQDKKSTFTEQSKDQLVNQASINKAKNSSEKYQPLISATKEKNANQQKQKRPDTAILREIQAQMDLEENEGFDALQFTEEEILQQKILEQSIKESQIKKVSENKQSSTSTQSKQQNTKTSQSQKQEQVPQKQTTINNNSNNGKQQPLQKISSVSSSQQSKQLPKTPNYNQPAKQTSKQSSSQGQGNQSKQQSHQNQQQNKVSFLLSIQILVNL